MKKNNSDNKFDNSLKLLAKSSIIVFIGLLLSKLFFYLYRIITVRFFGLEIYGLFSISIIVIGWFVAISSLGLFEGILRYISIYRAKKEYPKMGYIFRFSLSVIFIFGILSSVLLLLLSEFISINIFHDAQLIPFLRFFSILIPLTLFSYAFLAIIKSYEKIGVYSFILNISQNFIKFAILVLFIFLGLNINAVIFSYISGIFFMFLLSYLYCKYKLSEIWEKPTITNNEKIKLRKRLLSYSWPLMFFSLISGILPWIDTILLGYYTNMTLVGIYNVAVPLAILLTLSGDIFMQLFFPLITRHYTENNSKIVKELSKQVGKWIFMINLPVLIIMLLFPGTIINFLFGENSLFGLFGLFGTGCADCILAANSLRILSIGFFVFSIFTVSDSLIAISGRSKLNLLNILLASIVNLILNIFLIPKYGIEGAAVGTMISFIFFSFLRGAEAYYFLKIMPLRRKMLLILIVAIIPTIIIYSIRYSIDTNPITLILMGILFILIYIFLLFTTKCFDKNDLMILRAFKRKFQFKQN